MTTRPTTAIWWIRRDLRLDDNPTLAAALASAERVIPLFVRDPHFDLSPMAGEPRRAFLYAGLRELDAALQARGSRLIVRTGRPADVIPALVAESGAAAVYAEKDASSYALARDRDVAALAPLAYAGSTSVRPPGSVVKPDGTPYTVFTPFSKAWLSQPLPSAADLIAAPQHLPSPGDWPSEAIPALPALRPGSPFPPGEVEGRRRLEAFIAGPAAAYKAERDRMDLDGTSRLSPYLRFGMVSPRRAVVAALGAQRDAADAAARNGATSWLNELIWREFYIHILHHFPHVSRGSFRPAFDDIPWSNDETAFAAWREGHTGYPVVDAAMRQLLETGWMHNRARMIVASFLVKDLLVDWRWGERWFMQHLLDGDPASNNGGWQWTAGTGTDAAPYFRIFNPVTQGQKFDPDGRFVRRWLPELAGVPDAMIHEPWRLTPMEQRQAGCLIGRDYPGPIIDHAFARERTLAAYGVVKETKS
jgi:deoxyribodipyrimidine photo-lyase